MFWELREDTLNLMVRESMARNDFRVILATLHVDQLEPDPEDRDWKVRPLFDQLNGTAKRLVSQSACTSIDNRRIKYFGPNSLKQRIVGKPIIMGYKVWILATADG